MFSYNVFREARAASGVWNLCKSLAQLVVFWTIFLAVLPAGVYVVETWLGGQTWRFNSLGWRIVGGSLFAAASCLGFTSCFVMAMIGGGTPLPMDCARTIVIAGPYRYVRNPMAVAGLAQGVGVGLMFGSPAIVLYALVGGPIWNALVRPAEELDLEGRFGDSYRRYRSAVWCWIPRFPGYRPETSSPAESAPVSNANPATPKRQQP